jgi:SMC interacting uncharacterized protein involved in chromosome segregation
MNGSDDALEREFFAYASMIEEVEASKQDMDIPQALNGISRGLDIAERMRKFALQANNLEIVEFATELRVELSSSKNSLADAIEEIAGLKTENLRLRTEIDTLNKISKTRETLVLKNGVYYEKDDTGPYCPVCWVERQAKMPVSPSRLRREKGFVCSYCKVSVGG